MQGEHFNVTLCKGPRGFGFSLVAAPTFSSDVSQVTSSATATESLIFYTETHLLRAGYARKVLYTARTLQRGSWCLYVPLFTTGQD